VTVYMPPTGMKNEKKHSEVTQTLHAGYSMAESQTHRQGRLQYTAQLSVQCN